MYDVIIVGAGPAGVSAGLYAKRANKNVLILYNGESNLEKAVQKKFLQSRLLLFQTSCL